MPRPVPTRLHLALTVNGESAEAAVDPTKTLLEVLREDLQLTGTKHGCELGECGACAVLLDGEPVLSCLVLALECAGREVLTVEGLARDGRLDPLQETFADLGGSQCGYCTPGILVTARALLDREPNPSREQIREALAGNLCRCTGYLQIIEAVEAARLRGPGDRTLESGSASGRLRQTKAERVTASDVSQKPAPAGGGGT
jgi:aerobic-type carbon monoxide dehydrogenase small subunit (CoxS/CutS family)